MIIYKATCLNAFLKTFLKFIRSNITRPSQPAGCNVIKVFICLLPAMTVGSGLAGESAEAVKPAAAAPVVKNSVAQVLDSTPVAVKPIPYRAVPEPGQGNRYG